MCERPVVRNPKVSEQEQGDRNVTVGIGQIGKVQYDIVNASQERDFVARLLAVVAKDCADFVARWS
jgi:glutamate mutase epsilon subunit